MTDETAPSGLKREFMIERQGKWTPLYAGLLDLAHQQGLKKITTNLLQIPSPDNGNMAICYATVITERGEFTGLGDASPDNVARMMVPHILRMAETRAKARALRDAVNIGAAALEEMGEMAEEESERQVPPQRRDPTPIRPQQPSQPQTPSQPGNFTQISAGAATPNQIRFIYGKGREVGLNEQQIDEISTARFDKRPGALSKMEASNFINALQAGEITVPPPGAPTAQVTPIGYEAEAPYKLWAPKIATATTQNALSAMMATIDNLAEKGQISPETHNILTALSLSREKDLGK